MVDETILEELRNKMKEKDVVGLGYFLSVNEKNLRKEEYDKAVELLQSWYEDDGGEIDDDGGENDGFQDSLDIVSVDGGDGTISNASSFVDDLNIDDLDDDDIDHLNEEYVDDVDGVQDDLSDPGSDQEPIEPYYSRSPTRTSPKITARSPPRTPSISPSSALDKFHPLMGKLSNDIVALNLSIYQSNETVITGNTALIFPVLKSIYLILTHRVKSNLFGKQKSLIQIFSLLKPNVEFGIVRDFERLRQPRLLSDHRVQEKCILFLQYLLENQLLLSSCVQFFNSPDILKSHYEKETILNLFDHRFQFTALLQKIVHKRYSFGFPPFISREGPNLLPQVKHYCRIIIQHFMTKHKQEKIPLDQIGNEKYDKKFCQYVRVTICKCLLNLLEHGMVKKKWFKTVYLWSVFEWVAKKSPSYERNGITFSASIETINTVISTHSNSQILSDDKGVALICYFLNNGILDFMMAVFLQEVSKGSYYAEDSMILNRQAQNQLIQLLKPFRQLPFSIQFNVVF